MTPDEFADEFWRDHNPMHHRGEMRCNACGKVVCGGKDAPAERCACDGLRRVVCLVCGFVVLTGGPSLASLLKAHEKKTLS